MAKEKTGSDRQTAIRLGIEPSRIATARKKGQLGVEICARLAEIAGVDAMEVIAAAEVMKHPEKREFWSKWIAATVILSVAIMTNEAVNSGVFVAALIDHAIYYAHFALCALGLSMIAKSLKNGSNAIA